MPLHLNSLPTRRQSPVFTQRLEEETIFGEQASDDGQALGAEEAGAGLGMGFLFRLPPPRAQFFSAWPQ